MTVGAPKLNGQDLRIGKPFNGEDLRVGNPGRPAAPDMALSDAVISAKSRNFREVVPEVGVDRDAIVGSNGFRPAYAVDVPSYAGPGDFKKSLVFDKPGNDLVRGGMAGIGAPDTADFRAAADFSNGGYKNSLVFDRPGDDLIRSGMAGIGSGMGAPDLAQVVSPAGPRKAGGFKTDINNPISDLLY